MRDRLTWFLLGAATAGVFFALVVWRPHSSPPMVSAPVTGGQADLAARLESVDQRLVALETRMRTSATPTGAAASAPAAQPPVVPLTPAHQRAADAAGAIIDRAIASGRWTRRDALELSSTADLRGEDEMELRRQLAVAINEDRVKVDQGAEFN